MAKRKTKPVETVEIRAEQIPVKKAEPVKLSSKVPLIKNGVTIYREPWEAERLLKGGWAYV